LGTEARGRLVPEGDRDCDSGDAELPTEGLLPAGALPGDTPGVAAPAFGDGTGDPVAPLPEPGYARVPEELAAGELDIPGDCTGDTAVPGADCGNGEVPGTALGDKVVPAVSGTALGDITDEGRGSEADGEGGEREVAVGDGLVL